MIMLMFQKNIDITYPNRHRLIIGDSRITVADYLKNNKTTTFDIIFIDGGHDYNITKADMDKGNLLLYIYLIYFEYHNIFYFFQ
jgi:hypothetical protein